MDRPCNSCGSTDWSAVWEEGYPDHRRDRDQTIKTVYVCQSCDSEGKHFVHNNGGVDTRSGALR